MESLSLSVDQAYVPSLAERSNEPDWEYVNQYEREDWRSLEDYHGSFPLKRSLDEATRDEEESLCDFSNTPLTRPVKRVRFNLASKGPSEYVSNKNGGPSGSQV